MVTGGVAEDDDRGDQPGAGAEVDQHHHHRHRRGDDPAQGGVGLELLLVAADPAVSGARRQFEAAVLERGAQAGVGVAHHLDLAAAAGVEQHVLGALAALGADRHRPDGVGESDLARALGDHAPALRAHVAGGDADGNGIAGGHGQFGAARRSRTVKLR